MMQITLDFKYARQWILPAVSEISLYFFLYYLQYLLNVGQPVKIAGDMVNIWGGEVNLWASAALLWVMLNLAFAWCPFLNSCRKKKEEDPHDQHLPHTHKRGDME